MHSAVRRRTPRRPTTPAPDLPPGLGSILLIKCIFMHMNTYCSSRAGVYSSRAGTCDWQPKQRTAVEALHGGRSLAWLPKPGMAAEAAHGGRSRPCMAAEAAATRRAPRFPSARHPLQLRHMLPQLTGQSYLCTAGDSRNELLLQVQLHNHLCPI